MEATKQADLAYYESVLKLFNKLFDPEVSESFKEKILELGKDYPEE